jgi:LysM repeat protein
MQVTVQALPEFGLTSRTFVLSVATVDQLLGAGNWNIGGLYRVGSGSLYPSNPPEPALPTESDLTPPVINPGTGGGPSTGPAAPVTNTGNYVVQSGDTVYSIARKFNVTAEALIAANTNTLGFNPNLITPGQELVIPAP